MADVPGRDAPWTTERVTWERVAQLIEEGSVQSLGELRRSEAQFKHYQAEMEKVRAEYASVTDFLKISVLERACRLNADGKKAAVDMEHSANQLVWHLNDFPYYFDEGVRHWLLWSSSAMDRQAIESAIAQRFPPAEWDTQWFVNPAVLQSVLSIWHCHVLVRPAAKP